MTKARYNMALIGKTGVGKSTLINALLGRKVAEKAPGKPVTKPGFHPYDFDCGKVPMTLFDSWGLEAGKAEEWKRRLDSELSKRGPQKPPEGWFHTVLYCIGAGGARVEDFELDLMRALAREKYRILVVLTKADQATEEELESLRDTLNQSLDVPARVVPVCAEAKITLGGMTHVFGLGELRREIVDSFWAAISGRLPKRLIQLSHDMIDGWALEQHAYVDGKTEWFNTSKYEKELEGRAAAFKQELFGKAGPRSLGRMMSDEISRTTEMYLEFSHVFALSDLSFARELENVAFPKVKKGLRSALGAIFGLFSLTIVAIPLWLINKKLSKRDLHEAVDRFATELKDTVSSLEPKLAAKLDEMGKGVSSPHETAPY